jgi:hypothetical protein
MRKHPIKPDDGEDDLVTLGLTLIVVIILIINIINSFNQ